MEKIYYVYAHELNGEIIYIGKGKRDRAKVFSNRKKQWKDIVGSNENQIKIQIVECFDDETQAYQYEEELITYYKKIGQCRANVNIGRKHSEEIKQMISEKGKGESNSMYRKTGAQNHKSKPIVAIFPNGEKFEFHSKTELVKILNDYCKISGVTINTLLSTGEPFQARSKRHEKLQGLIVKYI